MNKGIIIGIIIAVAIAISFGALMSSDDTIQSPETDEIAETEVTEADIPGSECRSRSTRTQGLRRAGELRDTATATLWLLSDEAQFVIGAILDVSGGFVTP